MRSLTTFIALTSLALTYSQSASACSGAPCGEGDLLPKDGKVPANALAWLWNPSSGESFLEAGDGGAAEPRLRVFLESTEGDTELSLSSSELERRGFRLTPEDVAAGSVLRVEHTDTCSGQVDVYQVEVTASSTTPETLGTLEHSVQSGYLHIEDYSSSCSHAYYARQVDVELNPDPALSAFADAVGYSVLVDGKPFSSREAIYQEDDAITPRTFASGPLGAGIERVFALCDDGNGLWPEDTDGDIEGQGVTPGVHRVQMRGVLPDGTEILSEEIEVDLSCVDCSVDGGVTACDSAGDPDAGDAQVGSHADPDAAVEPHIDGGPSVPSNPTEHEAGVPSDRPDTDASADIPKGSSPDSGEDSVGTSTGSTQERDAGPKSPAVETADEAASDDDGCSFSPAARGSQPFAFGLGLIALALGLRSRRSRSAH
jgi:hypothetical protein